ncbi:hypothetical protein [Clostridium boliviensis]|uniref:hypothetical protein n=1 Tax=Clostridium boliviensis TaxID=318465 RepID=UPI002963FB13|nr:hypothetical protein [Clostridium boliviensis]
MKAAMQPDELKELEVATGAKKEDIYYVNILWGYRYIKGFSEFKFICDYSE